MKKLALLLIAIILLIGGLIGYLLMFEGVTFDAKIEDVYLPSILGDNVSAYKNSCSELNVSNVQYETVGKRVKVKGTIINKIEHPDNATDFEIEVPGSPYPHPETSKPYMVILYWGPSSYNIGDEIMVYGELQGPVIRAVYIEKS